MHYSNKQAHFCISTSRKKMGLPVAQSQVFSQKGFANVNKQQSEQTILFLQNSKKKQ